MGVKFLSEEWAEASTKALNGDAGFTGAAQSANLGIQFEVDGAPGGEQPFYLQVADGRGTMALGELEGGDVTIKSDYDTAVSIFTGELNTQMAFMTGKIKVEGNMAVLLMNQAILQAAIGALSGVEVEA